MLLGEDTEEEHKNTPHSSKGSLNGKEYAFIPCLLRIRQGSEAEDLPSHQAMLYSSYLPVLTLGSCLLPLQMALGMFQAVSFLFSYLQWMGSGKPGACGAAAPPHVEVGPNDVTGYATGPSSVESLARAPRKSTSSAMTGGVLVRTLDSSYPPSHWGDRNFGKGC